MRQLYRNIIKFFLPVLFISYMAGITLFTHSHVVNGVTIVHSHPFKKGTEHNHTTVEFQLLHLLNQVLVTDSGLLPIFVVSVYHYYVFFLFVLKVRVIAGLVRVLSLLGHLLSLSLHLSKLLFIFRNSTYYCFRFLYYFLNLND